MNGESKIPPGISVQFGARRFLEQEELERLLDNVPPKYRDEERAHIIAKIVDTVTYKAIESHGLNDMTITIKKQSADKSNFRVEGWMFELHGKKEA